MKKKNRNIENHHDLEVNHEPRKNYKTFITQSKIFKKVEFKKTSLNLINNLYSFQSFV